MAARDSVSNNINSEEKQPQPSKPLIISADYSTIPYELTTLNAWNTWEYQWHGEREAWVKVPIVADGTRGRARTNDPSMWRGYYDAMEYSIDGPSLLFVEPYGGMDLDNCRDPQTGVIKEWAARIVQLLGGYWEVSPSGEGLKTVFRLLKPLPQGRRKRGDKSTQGWEVATYDWQAGRFFCMTGHVLDGYSELSSVDPAIFYPQFERGELDAVKTNGHAEPHASTGSDTSQSAVDWKYVNEVAKRLDYDYEKIWTEVWATGPYRGKWEQHRTYIASTIRKIVDAHKPKAPSEAGKIKVLSDIPDILTKSCVPPVYVIPAINLCRGSICQWVGRDGIGKSWIGLSLAVAVATGGDFLGMKCEKMPVLFLDYQNPDHEIQKRARLITGSSSALADLHVWGNWCEQEPARFESPTLLDIAQKDKPLIIPDPFVHFHNRNENHPEDMVPVMRYLRRLANFGATILFTHHSPLVDEERGRGTLAIRAECELAIVHTRKSGLHNLEIKKNRFGAPKTIEADINFEEGKFTVRSGTVEPKESVQDFLRKNPGHTTDEIARALKIRKLTVVETIKRGMESGMFVADEDKAKGSTYYRAAVPDLDTLGSENGNATKQSTSESAVPDSGTAKVYENFDKVSPKETHANQGSETARKDPV